MPREMNFWEILIRPFTHDCDLVHEAGGLPIIVDGIMHGASVIPQDHVAWFPTVSVGSIRIWALPVQIIEKGVAFFLSHILETRREFGVADEERFSFGLRVRADCWMKVGWDTSLMSSTLRHFSTALFNASPIKQRLHTVGEGLVGQILITPHGVTTARW